MREFLYFIIAAIATTAGSLTGMGGGVIIKPVLDLLQDFDVATINVLSSVTVYFMTIISIAHQIRKVKIDFRMAIPLAIGSLAGGNVGQYLFHRMIVDMNGKTVTSTQNIILAIIIVIIFMYMLNKDKLKSPKLRGIIPAVISGLTLGIISSFLGIGGGPINVAIIIYIFALDIKSAATCSLITIFFAQSAKLATILVKGGFEDYDLTLMPIFVIGALLGGFVGSALQKKLPEKFIEIAFNTIQVVVFILCIINIFRNW